MLDDLSYSNAIEQIMLDNGFYAPLQLLYKEIWNYKDKSKIVWKTPDYTIQAIVQRDKRFTKIGLWVYALAEHLDKLPKELDAKTEKQKEEKSHARLQWMLIEIGNISWFETYTPDKKGIFINRELGKISTLQSIPDFTYPKIINDSIRFVDVIWFNERGFPARLFEVENSTDFRAGFIKFNEIQDFRTDFFFVAPGERKQKFETEKTKAAFSSISERCGFLDYNFVEKWYNNQMDGKQYKI
jgi:hypothetical protein